MNSKAEILDKFKKEFASEIINWKEKSVHRYYVEVKPSSIRKVTDYIFNTLGARFQIATGIDTLDAIEVLYHWAFDKFNFIVTIVVKLDRNLPQIESLADICKGIEWIEREMWELLGIKFKNHPDMRHLLLADDWPEGVYPLRRDFKKGVVEWSEEKI